MGSLSCGLLLLIPDNDIAKYQLKTDIEKLTFFGPELNPPQRRFVTVFAMGYLRLERRQGCKEERVGSTQYESELLIAFILCTY